MSSFVFYTRTAVLHEMGATHAQISVLEIQNVPEKVDILDDGDPRTDCVAFGLLGWNKQASGNPGTCFLNDLPYLSSNGVLPFASRFVLLYMATAHLTNQGTRGWSDPTLTPCILCVWACHVRIFAFTSPAATSAAPRDAWSPAGEFLGLICIPRFSLAAAPDLAAIALTEFSLSVDKIIRDAFL